MQREKQCSGDWGGTSILLYTGVSKRANSMKLFLVDQNLMRNAWFVVHACIKSQFRSYFWVFLPLMLSVQKLEYHLNANPFSQSRRESMLAMSVFWMITMVNTNKTPYFLHNNWFQSCPISFRIGTLMEPCLLDGMPWAKVSQGSKEALLLLWAN
jgi:hypothetical protein